MAELNKLTKALKSGNTGIGGVYFDAKMVIGAFLCPKGFELDVTDVQASLLAATHNSSKKQRIYPIYDFLTPKDSSEQKVVQTFNTGAAKVVREGFNDWSFQFVQGGLTLLQELRKFNGSNYDFLFVDDENRLIGITGSNSNKLRAVPSNGGYFWTGTWKVNDGSKVAEYDVQFRFKSVYLTDFIAMVENDFDIPTTIYGLQDVTLSAETGGTAGTYKITATNKVKESLADLFPTVLAGSSAPSNWIVTNAATSASITVTSISVGVNTAGVSCFVFVLDTADTDYPTTGGSIKFNLASPTTLQTAGVDGFESTGAASIIRN